MKIAITQRILSINHLEYDCLDSQWYSFLSPHEVIPIPNCDYFVPEFDVLIISGGDGTTQREKIERRYIKIALDRNIPIIGICHGAFLLNTWYNGENEPIRNHHNSNHTIEMDNELYAVNSFHAFGISITGLGEQLIPVATHENMVESFEHKELPIYGIVWHPERMGNTAVVPKKVKELLYA